MARIEESSNETGDTKILSRFYLRTILIEALSFLLIALILTAPLKIYSFLNAGGISRLKAEVLGASEAAKEDISMAGSALGRKDYAGAQLNFAKARENFNKAGETVGELKGGLLKIAAFLPSEKMRLASHGEEILSAGSAASSLGEELSAALSELPAGGNGNFEIGEFASHIKSAGIFAEVIDSNISRIPDSDMPENLRISFVALKDKSAGLAGALKELEIAARSMYEFLGGEQDKRYLLVFQNNAELRATGGFIGSYALADFSGGKLKKIEAPGGGSYDTEGGMREFITAPEPLRLLRSRWFFWDANWKPDWPDAAEKLCRFFEKSSGTTVNGAIAITPAVAEKLLAALGPVSLGEPFNIEITAENFWQKTQAYSEDKNSKESKRIIGALLDAISLLAKEKMNKEVALNLMNALEESVSGRDVLVYSRDAEHEELARAFGADGRVLKAERDYLMVADSNIGGEKTDRVIDEEVRYNVDIGPDGIAIANLEISRKHNGAKREAFTGARNVNWMRIYVPLGSELLDAGGFNIPDSRLFQEPEPGWISDPSLENEKNARVHAGSGTRIYDEYGKTVFANWTMVDPGGASTTYFKYRLPFKIEIIEKEKNALESLADKILERDPPTAAYSLLVQKQAGKDRQQLEFSLDAPPDWKPIWTHPAELAEEGRPRNAYRYSAFSSKDIAIGALFGKADGK
jgi:hypothetical protein